MKLKSRQYLGIGNKSLCISEKFTITETYYHSLQKLPQHEHEKNNLVIVKNGTIIENFSGIQHFLSKGDILIHPRYKIHSDSFRGNSSVINIEIDGTWGDLKRIFRDTIKLSQTPKHAYFYRIVYKLLNYLDGKKAVKSVYIEDLLTDMLSDINDFGKQNINISNTSGWLEEVIKMLHNNEITLDSIGQIASRVDLHPVYMSRAFKSYTGFTMMEYYIKNRLNRACRDLAFSDLNITQIGLEANFYDQAHFIKTFKNRFGITPYKYRKQVRS